MAQGKGECEHPYYRSIGKGKKQCVKCGEVSTWTTRATPEQEKTDGTT